MTDLCFCKFPKELINIKQTRPGTGSNMYLFSNQEQVTLRNSPILPVFELVIPFIVFCKNMSENTQEMPQS